MADNGKKIWFGIGAVILITVSMSGQEGKKESTFNTGSGADAPSDCSNQINSRDSDRLCWSDCFKIGTQELYNCLYNIRMSDGGRYIPDYMGLKVGGFMSFTLDPVIGRTPTVPVTQELCPHLNDYAEVHKALYQCFAPYASAGCSSLRSSGLSAIAAWISNPTSANRNNALNAINGWKVAC